ncbi:hypothetical protein BJ123_106101 [Rhodopseudomonas thermotolerans]|uniref:DUF2267 domain-containing protein n=2 Tax=Rhodopseudomonas TaxID=1073 RepID=A0A336JKP1_9BRAD|nr:MULTISPECIES: DUF2267 domain-containing protein [Rhodopseudomonas]RED37778.1 hypothetical protein BJ125_106102 [Rhodopseudomonas pentothenatexigens]REG04512.1 hypothetical protein BJ123_106101 [Rhodopseudomonas thermotolerans]SSW90278.1 hypothetical protein SAMN05892882_106102 [Rhodopseudomonas pentothenatexigens]
MDELIERLADKAGLDESVAEKTIGIILAFLRNEGPQEPVQALIDSIAGAEAAIGAAASSRSGLSRLIGGSGVMAMGTKLLGLGLSMSDIKTIARELFKAGRDRIGAEKMGAILEGTPGLRQFT